MLKYVKSVEASLNPLNPNARSLRLFLQLIRNPKNLLENPKCTFKIHTHPLMDRPIAHIQYVDGHVLKMNTDKMTETEMYQDALRHANKLRIKDDIAAAHNS